jgi:glucose/arabinose dehydrogenase
MTRRIRGLTLFAAVALLSTGPLVASVADAGVTAADVPVLLSQGRPVAASSSGGCCPAKNAVDGKSGTRWASAPGAGTQWLRVDLGTPRIITRVRLEWDASCASAYRIETSNNATDWTAIRTTTGDGGVDDLTVNGSGRYVRMLGTERCRTGSGNGYSLREFKVYGFAGMPSPPNAPLNPRARPLTCHSVEVSFDPPVTGPPVYAFDVYNGGVRVAVVPAEDATFQAIIDGLREATTYTFRVVSRDAAGNVSPPSAAVTVATPPCEGEPPTVPTNLRATLVSGTCVGLAWNPSTDNVGVAGYHLFQNNVQVATPTSTSWSACGLTVGTSYTFEVSAFDPEGNESARSTPLTFVLPPPCVCQVTEVATSDDVPWGLVTLPDRSILFTERDKHDVIRISPTGVKSVVGTVPNVQSTNAEGGLTGLEINPVNFSTDHWLYIMHTSPSDNRVVRIKYENGTLVTSTEQVLLTGIARNKFHNGGRLRFSPDGKYLFAATGDAQNGARAQDLASLSGKILRMNPDGTVPADNPFPGSYVWSYGHRNIEGMAFDSRGRLWASELGNSLMDELNLIVKGGNYGWPFCEGTSGTCANFVAPVRTFPVAQASPAGVAIVNDVIYVAMLRGAALYRMVITGDTTATPVALFRGVYGRLRIAEPAPDGGLWLTTSNYDNLGAVKLNRILHVKLQ